MTVDKLIHQPDVLTSPARPHCFAYHITIHNDGDDQVTIRGRKWVVTEASGEVTAVEGDGVVGEFPEISAGEHFSYNSFHVIRSNRAMAEGSYLGINENGAPVVVRIPPFELVVPAPDIGYCCLALAPDDAGLGQVVGRHFHGNLIPDGDTNPPLAHLA